MFDLEGFKRAMTTMDSSRLEDFYDEEAVVTIVDHDRQPKDNVTVEGLDALVYMVEEVAARPMTHSIEDIFLSADGNHLAFTDYCVYAGGAHVVVASVAELVKGKIVKQLQVQAWDN